MSLPSNISDLEGPLYILTHPKEFNLSEWRPVLLSCLLGEHGEVPRKFAWELADKCGIEIPAEYTR